MLSVEYLVSAWGLTPHTAIFQSYDDENGDDFQVLDLTRPDPGSTASDFVLYGAGHT